MEETEKTEERYHATVSPYPYSGCWMVRYYDRGRQEACEAYSFRWYARWKARLRLKQMRAGTDIIR